MMDNLDFILKENMHFTFYIYVAAGSEGWSAADKQRTT